MMRTATRLRLRSTSTLATGICCAATTLRICSVVRTRDRFFGRCVLFVILCIFLHAQRRIVHVSEK